MHLQLALVLCLSQEIDSVLKPVGFTGRGLTSAEWNYTTTEQECIPVVWAIQHFWVYLEGQEFELLTDHNALRYIHKQTDPRGRIARWIAFLNQFTYTVKHVPGTKDVVPDALSCRDYDFTDEAIEAFPDLGAIRMINKTELSGSIEQTRVQFGPNPQVITYQPSKPVKDLKHTGASFGSSTTNVWGEIKIKAPSKVNARRERLQPPLMQKAQENMADIDLRRENALGTLPESDTDARSILLSQEDYIVVAEAPTECCMISL